MNRASPTTLLVVLVVAVPIVVAVAVIVGFLLYHAGFGLVVWGLLPFLTSMSIIAVLGTVLGRAASGRGGQRRGDEDGV